MQRLLILVFFTSLLVSNSACHAKNVLMIIWGEKSPAELSFENELKLLYPGVNFTYLNPKRNKTVLASMLRRANIRKYDLVYTFGSDNSLFVKRYLRGRIPQIFNIVSLPVSSKIAEELHAPGSNLTGVVFLVNIEEQLKILDQLKGNYKTLGVLYDPRALQSEAILNKLYILTEQQNRKVVPIRLIPDSRYFKTLLKNAHKTADKLDALYIIPSSSFIGLYRVIHSGLNQDLLVMTTVSKHLEVGSTVALGANIVERSLTAARIANRILRGEPAGKIPVQLVTKDKMILFVNKDRMKQVGLKNIENIDVEVRYISERKL